jgi:polyisoprenyl-phosphate glycosyltransferase
MYSYSIIVPVYRNEENIEVLLGVLSNLASKLRHPLEIVFVVDGSPDRSLSILRADLPHQSFDSQLIAHSRNFGSFAAIRTGLCHARGVHAGVMAADLQEPSELLLQMFELLERGEADVVFGRRTSRNDPVLRRLLSTIFWHLYRRLILPDMPAGGVDIFACNKKVKDALLAMAEARSSIIVQLFWVGYRRAFVAYVRRQREHGRSAWSFRKRLEYMFDSVFSVTDLPIQALFWLGIMGIFLSLGVSVIVFSAWFVGNITVPGYTPLVLLLTLLSSIQICALGIIGFYVWRVSENSRGRPLTLIASIERFEKSGTGVHNVG